jgi:MacB-like periplasmic core domain
MQVLLQDLRYSLRQFINNPGFTATALISLALGIGATTAVFSVIYAALVNPYPYPDADRIVRLTMDSKAGTADWANLNGPQIQQVRQLSVVYSVLAMDFHALTMTGHDVPENVNVIGLISNGFTDLGVPPVLGRGLLPSDAIDGQDPQPVVVLSYKFWQKHFLGNPDAVGKTAPSGFISLPRFSLIRVFYPSSPRIRRCTKVCWNFVDPYRVTHTNAPRPPTALGSGFLPLLHHFVHDWGYFFG